MILSCYMTHCWKTVFKVEHIELSALCLFEGFYSKRNYTATEEKYIWRWLASANCSSSLAFSLIDYQLLKLSFVLAVPTTANHHVYTNDNVTWLLNISSNCQQVGPKSSLCHCLYCSYLLISWTKLALHMRLLLLGAVILCCQTSDSLEEADDIISYLVTWHVL